MKQDNWLPIINTEGKQVWVNLNYVLYVTENPDYPDYLEALHSTGPKMAWKKTPTVLAVFPFPKQEQE